VTWQHIAMAMLVLLAPAVRSLLPPDKFFTLILLASSFMGLWVLGWMKDGNRRKGPSILEHHRKYKKVTTKYVVDYMESNFLYDNLYMGICCAVLVFLIVS